MINIKNIVTINGKLYLQDSDGVFTPMQTGIVDGNEFVDGEIVGNKLQDNSISSSKLQDSGVSSGSYGNNIQIPSVSVNTHGFVTGISTNTLRSASATTSGIVPSFRNWTNFSGGSIVSGGGNLNLVYYWWSRIGNIVHLQGRINSGSGGGSSSDEVAINLPANLSGFNLGPAIFRQSGGVQNRRGVACTGVSGSNILRFLHPSSGYVVGNSMTSTNGEIWWGLTYRTPSSTG